MINKELAILQASAVYIASGCYIEAAADMFESVIDVIDYNKLSTKQKKQYLEALNVWIKKFDSEIAREKVKNTLVKLTKPFEFKYYILAGNKKILHPLARLIP